MALSQISIPVSPDVADAFVHASEAERNLAIRVFIEFLGTRSKEEAISQFNMAQARLGQEAQRSGLSLEILEDILADEE